VLIKWAQNTQTLNWSSSDLFCGKGATTLEKVEFECRKCAKTVSVEQRKISPFCPACGTLLNVKAQPKHWLFQFNPSIYKWFDRIQNTREPEQWLISQHFQLIHKDDLVAIWSSGQKAGIYALGKIITNPKQSLLNLGQEKYFLEEYDIGKFQEKYSAYVEYFKICLEKPLLKEECNKDTVLSNMQILTNSLGTNFRLTFEEWVRIQTLIGN